MQGPEVLFGRHVFPHPDLVGGHAVELFVQVPDAGLEYPYVGFGGKFLAQPRLQTIEAFHNEVRMRSALVAGRLPFLAMRSEYYKPAGLFKEKGLRAPITRRPEATDAGAAKPRPGGSVTGPGKRKNSQRIRLRVMKISQPGVRLVAEAYGCDYTGVP